MANGVFPIAIMNQFITINAWEMAGKSTEQWMKRHISSLPRLPNNSWRQGNRQGQWLEMDSNRHHQVRQWYRRASQNQCHRHTSTWFRWRCNRQCGGVQHYLVPRRGSSLCFQLYPPTLCTRWCHQSTCISNRHRNQRSKQRGGDWSYPSKGMGTYLHLVHRGLWFHRNHHPKNNISIPYRFCYSRQYDSDLMHPAWWMGKDR